MSASTQIFTEQPPRDSPAEYADFVAWLRDFFAQNDAPEGVHAIIVFNRAYRAGFSRASKWMFDAVEDGTLARSHYNRLFLAR